MAREDFCFTYYDGDAAHDKAHMTRLQRGAYDDIISAQRKRGHLTLEDIQRVLSKDFEECWPALQWVLKTDQEQKFYIPWVDTSLEKSRKNSQRNKERIEEYWRKVDAGEIIPRNNRGNSVVLPRNESGIDPVLPYEYGIGNEDKKGFKEDGVEGTNQPVGIVPDMHKQFTDENPGYPADQHTDFPAIRCIAQKIGKWMGLKGDITIPKNALGIKVRWGDMLPFIRGEPHFSGYSLLQINKHFQSIVQRFNSRKNGTKSSSKIGETFEPD